jgi:hypothetical protein
MLLVSIFAYTLVVVFWLVALLLSWSIYKSVRAHKFFSTCLSIVALFLQLWCGLTIGITPGSSVYSDYRMTSALIGSGFFLGQPLFQYDSERSFNGDGYTIIIYRLSDNIARKYDQPGPGFFNEYPQPNAYRSEWQRKHWHPTPVIQDDRKYLDFALSESVRDTHLDNALSTLRRLSESTDSYYSYFCKSLGDQVSNLDFFLLNTREKVLIIVNHNT